MFWFFGLFGLGFFGVFWHLISLHVNIIAVVIVLVVISTPRNTRIVKRTNLHIFRCTSQLQHVETWALFTTLLTSSSLCFETIRFIARQTVNFK